jgi:plasmid stabilization system protein ParE
MPIAAVLFHRLAAAEYRTAIAWYRTRSPNAAQRFRDEIRRVTERIAAAPHQETPFQGSYFWTRARRFPYMVYYEVRDPSLVVIYAVAHGRRRTGYWLRRTRRP